VEKDYRNSEMEKQLLRLLARQIEKQLNKGPVSDWSQRDFIALSETIENLTKEQISVTTLKRVFGKVEYSGLPYIHTLNVLAQFVGFAHWSEFKKKELGIEDVAIELSVPKVKASSVSVNLPERVAKQNWLKITGITKVLLFIFGILSVFLLGWYGSWWWEKGRWLAPATINNISSPGKLSAEILYPDSFPVHVKFNYQGPVSDPDDLTVIRLESGLMENFDINSAGYGSRKHTFDKPGIYPIRIFCNRHQLAYFPFLVPSLYWSATIRKGVKIKELPIEPDEFPFLHLNNAILKKSGIDSNSRFSTSLARFKDYGLSGDNFTFTSAIRNNQTKPELKDQLSKILIRCANNSIHLQFAKILPRHGFFIQISDNYLSKGNLSKDSGFVQPLENWRVVKVQTKNKNCKVWIDNKLILEENYTLPLGDVVGLEYIFVGSGEVKNLQLSDKRGKIWEENFDVLN